MEILSPSYEHSPLIVYDLNGTELILRLPQHDGTYEPTLAASDVDIFDHSIYTEGYQPIPYLILIKNSWTYRFANSPIDAGHLILGIGVTHYLEGQETDFLNKASFSQWVLTRFQENYGPLLEEEILELKANDLPIIEEKMWQYPKAPGDLKEFLKCGIHWCMAKTGHPSMGKLDPVLLVPINKTHALEISTTFGGFNPEYFDSIDTIEEIKETLLQEFLEHVHINYSPETLAEIS